MWFAAWLDAWDRLMVSSWRKDILMRTPEEKIKAAILHPEEEIRCVAVSYFADAYSSDPALMPLVIEAVEKYGRENAFCFCGTA